MDLKTAMMRSSGSATRAAATSALRRLEMEAPSVQSNIQVKTMGTVRSLKLAKPSKKELEKTLEKNRVERELLRAQIEKNKKEKAAEKKKAEEEKEMKKAGKDLKKCSKLALKKPSKLVKVEAAPKEAITPRVKAAAASFLTGMDGAYQSRPSCLPVSRIYVRAEIEKGEEATRVQQLGKIETEIEPAPKEEIVPTIEAPAVPVTGAKEGGLAEIEKQEEEESAQREWVRIETEWIRAEIEKNLKKEEEERKKQEEEERAQREWVRIETEWIRAEIEKYLKKEEEERKKQEEEERAQREWVRIEIEWIRAEIEKNLQKEEEERKKQEEEERAQRKWVRAEIEWIRAEIEKNMKEEEERKKQEEKKREEASALKKQMEACRVRDFVRAEIEKKREVGQAIKSMRKQIGDYASVKKLSQTEAIMASVATKGALDSESEPASPTRVLDFGSDCGSCSPSSSTFESDGDGDDDLGF